MNRRDESVQFLKKILSLPSVNGKEDEGMVAEYLSMVFSEYGIAGEVDRMDDTHANVLAFIEGEEKEVEIWNGHLDTVDYGNLELWQTDPKEAVEKEGKIYARGASDMKSGLAAMVYALCHLPKKPKRSIQFIGSCDEEKGGLGAKRVLEKKQMKESEFLLISEPSSLHLGVVQKGCLWLQVHVAGKTGHGAYPEQGVNAIHFLFRFFEPLAEYIGGFMHDILGNSTVQINKVEGGIAANMTADCCRAVLDIRTVPGLTVAMILEKANQIWQEFKMEKPELEFRFEILNQRRAIEIKETEPQVQELKKRTQGKGYDPKPMGINFFTDASVLAADDFSKKILIFGPGEPALAHQPNEYVEIQKYLDYIEILMGYACDEDISF